MDEGLQNIYNVSSKIIGIFLILIVGFTIKKLLIFLANIDILNNELTRLREKELRRNAISKKSANHNLSYFIECLKKKTHTIVDIEFKENLEKLRVSMIVLEKNKNKYKNIVSAELYDNLVLVYMPFIFKFILCYDELEKTNRAAVNEFILNLTKIISYVFSKNILDRVNTDIETEIMALNQKIELDGYSKSKKTFEN